MKPGEKITIIFGHGVVLTETREPREDERCMSHHEQTIYTYVWTDADATGKSRVKLDEEGIRWLRGHYMPDAPEVSGARVAQALGKLAEPVEPRQHRPKGFMEQIIGNVIGTIAADMLHKLITKGK